MSEFPKGQTFTPALCYKDASAALDWLERAFGFERSMVITDDEGNLGHSEMRFEDGVIMIGSEWADYTAAPCSTGGKNSQNVHVQLNEDVDAHCARSSAAGAEIVRPPEDQFYGDRTYSARDPEGHVWTFGQKIRDVSRTEAERASGLNIEGWPEH